MVGAINRQRYVYRVIELAVIIAASLLFYGTARAQDNGASGILISANRTANGSGNNLSSSPKISADGRFVAFLSRASNLTPGDNNGETLDVFVRDRQTGKTTLVSVSRGSTSGGNIDSFDQVITPDGRYVAFGSWASNLVVNDTNGSYVGVSDVFVRDLQLGKTTLVSVNSAGTASGNKESGHPVITPDGRYIAFESSASDLVANDTNNATDIFVRDMQTGETKLVSVNSGSTMGGNGWSLTPLISNDGRYVVFHSAASDLVTNDTNGSLTDVFVRDMQTGETTLVSVNSAGTGSGDRESSAPAISSDGQVIAFLSHASNLVAEDSNLDIQDVFVRDLRSKTTRLVSINSMGTMGGNGESQRPSFDTFPPAISADGRYIVFHSEASDLVTNDTNGSAPDVFVRDMQTGLTELVSANSAGTGSGNSGSGGDYTISADGRFVAFLGGATDLVPGGTNSRDADLYVRDLKTKTTKLLSVNKTGAADANGYSYNATISADGRVVAFHSFASDLIENDTNSYTIDVFAVSLQAGRPQFSLSAYSVNEGGGAATVNVTRTGGSSGIFSVNYATSDGTARAGQDYTSVSGTLTFADKETSKTFTIPLMDDASDEDNETINLTLGNLTGGALMGTRSAAVLTIADNDPSPALSINDAPVWENTATALFTVRLSAASSRLVTVRCVTASGTAIAGVDYVTTSKMVSFAPGETVKTFAVPVKNDVQDEDNETFTVKLASPTGATILDGQGVGTIRDEDAPPSISINDVTVTEGNTGVTRAILTVKLSVPSGKTVMFVFSTADGTATAGHDYYPNSGGLTFTPGQTTKSIVVEIKGDTQSEPGEALKVNLGGVSNAVLGDRQGSITILDND